MVTYTSNYTVTGSGTIICQTDSEYLTAVSNLEGDTRFTVNSANPVAKTINYSMNFTITE